MKILKKILPLASIASVAAVAAPLATSCSTGSASVGTYTFSYDVEDTAGLTKYEPKFTPAPQQSTGTITPSVARTLYYSKLDADHSLLSDDFLCGLNAYILNLFKTNAKAQLSKLNGSSSLTVNSIEPYSVSDIRNDEKIELRKLSFTINWKFDFTLITQDSEGEEVEKKGSMDQKFEFKNFLLDVSGNDKTGYLSFVFNDKCGWELKFNSATSLNGSSESGSIVWDKDNQSAAQIATRFIGSGPRGIVDPVPVNFYSVRDTFSQIVRSILDDDGMPVDYCTHYLKNNAVSSK